MNYTFVLAGKLGVGKSAIFRRLQKDEFVPTPPLSNGLSKSNGEMEHQIYHITLRNQDFKIALWDTGGLERYHSMTSSYFRYSTAVILVYDASDQLSSLCALRVWIDEARRNSALKDKVILSLWANKSDTLSENSSIPPEVTAFLSEYSIPESLHFYVSAKTGYQLKDSFHQLIEHVYDTNNIVTSNSTNISATSSIPERRSWRDKLCNC